MKTTISITAAAVLAGLGVGAQAQEITARVISATPVIQQVQVPRQICNNQPVAVQQPRSGAGAVIGAIAGAALGNTIGHGTGRAVATGIGLVGGAAVGDRVEGGGPGYVQNMQTCTTQTYYENRTVGYNVAYEYDGRQYTVQMPYDPGPTIRLQVSPSVAAAPQDGYPSGSGEVMSAPPGTPVERGVVAGATAVYPAYAPVYPAYPAYPAYYPAYPFYAPIGISLGFGFSRGFGGHHHHGGHHHGGHRR